MGQWYIICIYCLYITYRREGRECIEDKVDNMWSNLIVLVKILNKIIKHCELETSNASISYTKERNMSNICQTPTTTKVIVSLTDVSSWANICIMSALSSNMFRNLLFHLHTCKKLAAVITFTLYTIQI